MDGLDRPALTTDVIVGFPGESDEDFADTCRVVEQIGFSKIHIFPFSARRGTPAAEMSDQVEPQVKSARHHQLAAIESELRQQYFQSLEGRHLRVLVESPIDGATNRIVGTSCRYAPVEMPAPLSSPGQLIDLTAGPTINGRIHAVEGT